MKNHIDAERINSTLLRNIEKSLLSFFVKIIPLNIMPDHLTTIGLIGSVVIALGYYLCNYNINYLRLANAGFLINWLGDSLDGSLARYRKIERLLYGFFIARVVDSISMLLIAAGNHCFSPESIDREYFEDSEKSTTCPWKCEAGCCNTRMDGKMNPDAAWFYPNPKDAARKIKGYVAFRKGIKIES